MPVRASGACIGISYAYARIGALMNQPPVEWYVEIMECPRPDRVGHRFFFSKEPLRIGRSDRHANVGLDDTRVSRRHVEIGLHEGAPYCRDLGSTHGVFVNGKGIGETCSLQSGDEITIGNSRLTVRNAQSAASSESGDAVDRDELARFYEDDVQVFKQTVKDEILSRLKLGDDAAGSRAQDKQFRKNVIATLDSVLEERWYQAPGDLERAKLRSLLQDDLLDLGPIAPYMRDDSISEVMVNGPDRVFIERRGGHMEETKCRFSNNRHVMTMIQRIVEPLGRRVDESSPKVDARLPDGSRVNAIINPLSLDGPAVTIRKFTKERLKGDDLVNFGSATPAMLGFLQEAVRARKNILISGGTGSGKTTLLNVLSQYIPLHERIVTVEDSAELQLSHRNLVRLEARPSNIEGKGEVTIRELVINCLRMRPDRIVVGECRGQEAFDMLQAMNTGHDGSLTTVHANTPRDALLRLENMVMMTGFGMPVSAIRRHIGSAIHLVIQQARLADGARKITNVSEVTGIEGDVISMQEIFQFVQTGTTRRAGAFSVEGHYEATGNIPSFVEELRARGDLHLDLAVFKSAANGRE